MNGTPTDHRQFVAEVTGRSGGLWQLVCHLDIRGPDGMLLDSTKLMESPPLIQSEGHARATARELARSYEFSPDDIKWDVRP
jgi:hypothetical protein